MNTTMTIVISFVSVLLGGVVVPLIANWLFDKFRR